MFSLLYVDDEPGLLELGKLFLESTGEFEVTTALSAGDGLGQLAQRDFDAIVSDFQMPVMDGIELLKRVRKSFGSIPFVLFTGRGREEVVIEAINNGVDFYLQKGGDPKAQFAELAHKVRQAVTRRRAEIALSDSEKRLADIINFLPDATFAIDTRGTVIAWNRAMERMTGVSSNDILGKGDYEYALPFYHERRPLLINLVLDDDPAVINRYPVVKKEGKTLISEISIPHFNEGRGAALWFTASPLYNRKGEVVGAIESIREITERKRAEESLVSANREYESLLDQIQDVYYFSDAEGRLVRASRSMATLLGYNDIAECIGRNFAEAFYFNPPDRKQLLEELGRKGKVTGYEVTLKRKDGTPVLIEASSHLCYDMAGKITGVEGTFHDITERKKSEDELRAANEQLVASDEELRSQYDELSSSERRVRLSETRLRYMLGFYEYTRKSERELLEYAIEGAGIVTGSTLGYLAFLNADESELSMYAWSKNAMAECSMVTKPIVYQVEKTGLWGEAVRQRRPVITNDYAAPDPAKKGYPEGHPHIIRHMNVPVSVDGHIVLVAGVANKTSDYSENDVSELLLLMQALWTTIRQKRAEEVKKKTDEELRLLKISTDNSSDQVFWLDFSGKFLYVNDTTCRDYGYTREEFSSMKIFDLNPDLTREIWEMSVSDLRERKNQFITTRHRRRDGSIMDVEIVAVYVNQDDREYSFAYVRDITERKQTADKLKAAYEQVTAAEEELREQYEELASGEKKIRESEEKYRSLVDLSPVGVVVHREGRIIYANPEAVRLSGAATAEDIIGRDLLAFIHPDDIAMAREDFRLLHEEGRTIPLKEERLQRISGDPFTVEITAIPIQYEGRSSVLVMFRDITDRKRAETELRMAYEHLAATDEELRGQYEELATAQAALQKSEKNFRALVENAPDAIYIQTNTRFRYLNTAALRLLGASSADELLGTSMWDRIHPSFHERIRGRVKNLTVDLQPVDLLEEVYVRLDGTPVDVEVKAVPFQYEGEHGVLVLLRDISARRQAETELRTAYEKLTASEEELRQQYGELAAVQADLQKNQQQLEEITGTVPGVVYQFYARPDGTMGLYYVSDRAQDVLGISSKTADFFERFTLHVDPRDRDAFLSSVTRAVEDKSSWDYTGRFIRPTGETIWFQGISRPFVRDNETVFSGFLLDITGRKQAEDELKLLKISADRSSDEVFWLEFSGRILYTNEAACRATGYSPAEFASMKIFDLDPDFRPGVWEASVADLRERKTQFITTRHRRKDGSIMDVEIVAVFVSLDEKEYSFAYVRDVTDRKRVEAALQQANLVVENSPVVVFRWEAKEGWPVAYVSRNVTQFGYTPEELMSGAVPFSAIVHPDDLERVAREVQTYSSEGPDEYQQEYRILTGDGDVRWIDNRTVIERDPEGRISHYQGIVIDITERKRAEAELRKNNNFTCALLDAIPTPVFSKDRDGRYIGCNRAFTDITGVSSEQLAGKTVFELWPSELSETYHRKDIELMEHPQHQIYEFSVRDREGTVRPVIYAKDVFFDGAGQVAGIVGAFLDISGLKQAEQALRESEVKFREFTELLPQIVFETDTDMTLTFVNRQAYNALGYSPDEVKAGINALSCIDPSQHDLIRTNIRKLIRKEPFEHPEYTFVRKDGSTFPALIFADPVMRGGTLAGFRGIIIDISGRKQDEEALRESEEKYRTLVEKSRDGIVVVQDERIVFANGALMEMIGYAGEELLGHSIEEFVAPEDAGVVLSRHRERMSGKNVPSSYEYSLLHKDGVTRITVKMDAGIATFHGDPAMIATFQNITLERKREDALRESEEKYRTLVESSFDGIAIHQDGIVVYVNRTGARLLGSDDPSVFIGKPAIDIIAPAFREQIAQRIREAPESMQELIREQFLRLDGTPIDVDVMTKPSMWKGRPAAYVTFRDITAQLRADEALRESSRKYAELFELGSEAIFLIDNETGALLETNSAACDMYGYPRDVLLTMKNTDLSAEQEETRKVTTETPHGIVRVPLRYHRRNDGTVFPVEIIGRFFVWNGRPVHIAAIRDITEHKQAEAALRESEEKYRTLVEVNRDIIYSLSTDGTVLYVSPQTITLLGYRPDEMEGRNISDFVHPDDVEKLVRHIQEHSEAGKPVPSDRFRVRRNDGTYRWFEDKTIYATDPRGNIIVAGTIRDITEEKAVQDALRESEEKFRALVETTGDFIWETDAAGKYTYVSPQVRDILGYEPGDLAGRTPFDIMPRDEAEKISARFNHLVASRLPVTGLENKAIRKDGSVVILETSGVVRTANDGSFLGYRGIDRDITVRKQAEEALRESEDRTRTILNTAQAGIVLVDAVTHQIVDANKKALELIGLDRGSVVGTICHRFICPAEMGKCPVTDLGQQVDTSERVLITAAGRKIPVLKTVVPITLSGRNVLIESFVDISEQKRSEAAIREANRKLNLLNSITRHDIRNQLMVAQGFAQLAALSKPDATVLDFLAKITAAIETIQRQIEFTKAYQELGVHAPSWFLFGEVISSVRPGMIALCNTCKPVEIYADPMIDKVFFNLFDNAMKYGERVTEVTVGCKETDDYLVITFADNGCGIPPAEKKKIFEKGYGKNTGLGLFLVREILAITGITIHETGTYGEGAVFEIIIPGSAYRRPEQARAPAERNS